MNPMLYNNICAGCPAHLAFLAPMVAVVRGLCFCGRPSILFAPWLDESIASGLVVCTC